MPDTSLNNKNDLSLEAKIEALLFITPTTTTLSQIADALNITQNNVQQGLQSLSEQLQERGIRIQENKGRYQLTTAPELSHYVEEFLQLENTSKLSVAALETLAIVAYQQPVTRPSVDSIRGVNSDGVIRTLLSKGLIEEVGRSDGPGRPILYSTAPEFLQYFGLASLKELPPIDISLRQNTEPDEAPTQTTLPIDNHLLKE
jgi:segregation and condensation protein B